MASKHLSEDTCLSLTIKITESGQIREYDCEACGANFFFENVSHNMHPNFCPQCGRRAKIE